ncbi:MAG: type II toxin-antitoxin system VapC family toxin [Candidatus Daviesbacteria bacterium]
MNIIVDSDALLALINLNDSLHSEAKVLLNKLYAKKVQLLILPTTLSEFSLIAVNRIGLPQVKAVVAVWTEGGDHQIVEIDKDLINFAVRLFQKQTSKEESLFDCFVMAAASKYKYEAIFSFDKGYKKTKNNNLNLKLAADLFLKAD